MGAVADLILSKSGDVIEAGLRSEERKNCLTSPLEVHDEIGRITEQIDLG